jgi:hypothetical protein
MAEGDENPMTNSWTDRTAAIVTTTIVKAAIITCVMTAALGLGLDLGLALPASAQQPAGSPFDKPIAVQKLPPKPGGDPYEIVCTTYSGFMVRERRDGPSSQDAAIVRGSRPVCDARKVPGEIVLKTSDKYLIGRKGPFLIFSEMDPHGAVPFVIVDAGSGRIIFKDATVGNPDFRSAALEKGVLRLRYARGFNAPCSILQDAKGCWAKLVAAGMIPAAMAREVPSPRICDAAYKAMSGAPADAPSIVSYDVDMRVTAKGTTQFLSRGAVHCGIVP